MIRARYHPCAMTPERKKLFRLVLLALFIFTLLAVGELTGLRHWFTIVKLRQLVLGAGALGVVLYAATFIVGELIHIPGLLFVCAGVAIWGRLVGGMIAWGAGTLAIAAVFVVVRAVGGTMTDGLKHPWIRRALDHLDSRPIVTVIVLRAVLVISPPVTYALALSPVRFWHFFIGSAIGLLPPMMLVAIFFEYVLKWTGN